MLIIFYIFNLLLFFSLIVFVRNTDCGKRISISLLQVLTALLVLGSEYFLFAFNPDIAVIRVIFFSETIFALILYSFSLRLRSLTKDKQNDSQKSLVLETLADIIIIFIAFYYFFRLPFFNFSNQSIIFKPYSGIYNISVLTLVVSGITAWRVEYMWRSLNTAQKWEYKFLVVGSYLVCGSMAWSSSFRITYLVVKPDHLILSGAVSIISMLLISYAVFSHRLLNRKIYISRKVVYSFVVPFMLSVYLVTFGLISIAMASFDLKLNFITKWLFILSGLIAVTIFSFSGRLRRKVHFFISTHFYINKYEYRDEWLALSRNLHGADSETEVIKALRRVLYESLYTVEIFLWAGDDKRGYILSEYPENFSVEGFKTEISKDDLLISYFVSHQYFHLKDKEGDKDWVELYRMKKDFFNFFNIILIAPISVGSQIVGLIGLGPEYTGGKYGNDDFDLLKVLGLQTATALMGVKGAELLANNREQNAWNRLSRFVMHDIKNAATMLSLLQVNASKHIHEPEFQQDMLELVDDTLKRMLRVEECLKTFKSEIDVFPERLNLSKFLNSSKHKITRQLNKVNINIDCDNQIYLSSDPELLFSILENLLLNSFEAKSNDSVVDIDVKADELNNRVNIYISDNGPGISEEMLPDKLFEPFSTSKETGSGVGLWQVRKIVESLEGSISAKNKASVGAVFLISFPL